MPGADSTTYLVRHAKAGSRERWTAPDRDRPLTDSGRAQAAALAVMPQRRSQDTVLPPPSACAPRS